MSEPVSLEALSAAFADLTEIAAPSVVAVRSHRSLSSGFAWRTGLIVTADEALTEEGELAVTLPGGEHRAATLAGRDPTTDVALLRVEGADLRPAALDAGAARPGALVLAVGSSHGAPLAAFGAVAHVGAAWRSMRGGEINVRIDLDLHLRRQAEGGLVLDATGRGLGMAVFGPRRRVLVIPAATIDRVAGKLATHGRIARGYLGLGLQPVRLDGDAKAGAMVMSVDASGPGAAAGVRQGDVIVAWQGEPLTSVSGLIRALGPESVGQDVTLALRRGGAPVEVRLTLGERPPA